MLLVNAEVRPTSRVTTGRGAKALHQFQAKAKGEGEDMGKRNYYFEFEPIDWFYRYVLKPLTFIGILIGASMICNNLARICTDLVKINNTLVTIDASINKQIKSQARTTTVMTAQFLKSTDHDFKCDIAYDFTYPGETNYFIREISDVQKRNPFRAAEFSLTNCNKGE